MYRTINCKKISQASTKELARLLLTPGAKEKSTSSKERKGKEGGKPKRRLILEESSEYKLAKATEKPPGKMREVRAER